MGVKLDYLTAATDAICQLDPTLDRDEVNAIIRNELKNDLRDPTITLDNNVTGAQSVITLTELCNWISNEKPTVAGNATFYCQPEVLMSPTTVMLKAFDQERDSIKSAMFNSMNDPDKYEQLNLEQTNLKVRSNAEYGASGTQTSAFYSRWSPPATTLMAQSVITTVAMFFEAFIGNNQKFFHVNECIDWLHRIRTTKKEDIPKWIIIPNHDEVASRIISKLHLINTDDIDIINSYIQNCKHWELVYIFYANNLLEFIRRHDKLIKLLRGIMTKLPILEAATQSIPEQYKDRFSTINQYNDFVVSELFLNPYSIPNIIKDDITQLTNLCMKFCFVSYLTPDSMIKLNYTTRNTIILGDTDSNVINSNIFIQFVLDEIFNSETFGRTRLYNDMICANILSTILSSAVKSILSLYCISHNLKDDGQLNMKNEYFFRRVLLMNVKKRYATSIVLREGHISIPFVSDIKGVDFIKAGVDDIVTERFTRILEENILFSDKLELRSLMREVRLFEKDIRNSLLSGELIYLKTSGFKVATAYKNPWSIQVFKAVQVWNAIHPDQKISSLSKVKLAKLAVNDPSDLDIIKEKHPIEYERAITEIFGGTERYLEYVAVCKQLTKVNDARMKEMMLKPFPMLMRAGMGVIAIPLTVNKIPDWISPLLDVQIVISDTMNSFKSVLDSFNTSILSIKTPHGNANVTSGLISM